ncbi:PREDICTED: zinc finger BED domain-containing protein RICESLEEPER 2-like [Camelina sativa]|uniref:Zinc finger BED domain-containing protein RICESLEEPER 2-like n=1 Tax=Camelina sativa TaxID=90675 RepID=A0ABM0XEL9_CAMSA|nr:PREDICTED: zinc finger BED domain-containing protein RICESLEEPER 2-like [Camelina sativa]
MDSCSHQPRNDDNEKDGEEVESHEAGHETGYKRKKQADADGSAPKVQTKKKKAARVQRSFVWDHFTRIHWEKDRCRCHYCTLNMGCATHNGTSCLKNHLLICKQYKTWKETRSETQNVLSQSDDNGLQLARVIEDVFREASNEMLVLGELPLSFIESLAWKNFCNKVKLYKPHSWRTATRDIVEAYVKKKAEMMEAIGATKQRFSLTTDIWVAPTTGTSYMVITTLFIDASWRLRKMIIGFKHVADHTRSTISSVLLKCLAEWGIKKIFTITVDNATANSNAMKKFKEAFSLVGNDAMVFGGKFLHLRCCAHIINLIAKDGLHDLKDNVEAIWNGVQYVRASSKRLEAFEQKVESGKMTRGSLSLNCKTRWNSTYLMLTRALKFRLAFDRMEAEDKLYNDYFCETVEGKKRIGPPCKDNWDEIERLVRFLVIFYNSTLVVSASSTVSSYKCYNEIVTIERNLSALSTNSDLKLSLKAEAMRDKFNKYWDGSKKLKKMLIIAIVFDPRNKMKFASLCFDILYGKDNAESKEITKVVNEVLVNLFNEYNATTVGSSFQSQTASSSQSGHESQGDLNQKMDFDSDIEYQRVDTMYNELVNEIGFQDASSELELYLKEKVETPKANQLGIKFDVLGWWRINSPKYPILASIAKDVLAMQVSSVASESAFSNSNRILDPFRSCLTHYMIEVLMCSEQWLKSEILLNEKRVITTQQMLAEIELQDSLQKEFESLCKL